MHEKGPIMITVYYLTKDNQIKYVKTQSLEKAREYRRNLPYASADKEVVKDIRNRRRDGYGMSNDSSFQR
jgi:hypothetical protein